MIEQVVYILGAGFSAPLGLPVMANFLEKSKDAYFEDQTRYSHFTEIFNLIKRMAVSKTYYETDLTNVEEILSILEMQDQLAATKERHAFAEYIVSVIERFTPPAEENPRVIGGNWYAHLFANGTRKDQWHQMVGYFVGSLLNLKLCEKKREFDRIVSCESEATPSISYSVITLNYDLVVENFVKFFRAFSLIQSSGVEARMYNVKDRMLDPRFDLRLAKLHGSVDKPDSIVPPTWNKSRAGTPLPAWQNAYKWLSEANHIRIIGYSLPIADAYVRYLLKAAVIESPHLKKIDVICRDSNGDTKRRYEEFIKYKNFSFRNAETEGYVSVNFADLNNSFNGIRHDSEGALVARLDQLEHAHSRFMA